MSAEMPDHCAVCVSVTSAAAGGRGALNAPLGGGAFSRSRRPICRLLAEEAAEERLARRLILARAGDEQDETLDGLREARARRRVLQEQAAVEGVDDRDEVVGDRVRHGNL